MEDITCTEFPPICPHCGQPTGWSGEFTLSEIAYIGEDAAEDEDGVVHVCYCGHCGHESEWLDDGEKQILLSCQPLERDEEEEQEPDDEEIYTPYALNLLNKMYHEE